MAATVIRSDSFVASQPTSTDAVRLSRVAFAYGRSASVLEGVDLCVARGELLTVLGASGCGKSTILNIVAGLLTPHAGSVVAAGAPVAGPSSERAVVFQDAGLFPWMTLEDNVGYPLRTKGVPRRERSARTIELLRLVRLEDHATKYPHELSGGMRQRGAIARALAADPSLLLMDEPFSALDRETRARLQDELLAIHASRRFAVLFVTHNVEEAVLLGDRVVVVAGSPGKIVHQQRIDVARPRRGSDECVARVIRELGDRVGESRAAALAS